MKKCMQEKSHLVKRKSSNRQGPSSFHMQDPEIVFNSLNIKKNDCILDLGCGSGDYTFYAASILEGTGQIYAVDAWPNLILEIKKEADACEIKNIEAMIGDIREKLTIGTETIDVCLISTVLHSLNLEEDCQSLFLEVNRVLKDDGVLSIIECKKEETDFGPPLSRKIFHKEMEEFVCRFGFKKTKQVDLGFNYMLQFKKAR